MTSRPPGGSSPTAHRTPTGAAALWGWARLLMGTAAQIYLVLLASLAAIALVPALFGWHGTVVQTGSMAPHIDPGDVVLFTDLPADQPVPVGGVVQFRSPGEAQPDDVGRLILHRIVGDNDDGTYTTAGDANADVDSTPLTREQITGQARILVPFIGLPALWLGTGRRLTAALWAGSTVLALLVTLAVFVPRQSGRADSGTGDDGTQELPVLARRGALAVAGATVLAGLLVPPGPPSAAAFTARTGTRASWQVAALPPVTAGRATAFALLARTAVNEGTPASVFISIVGDIGTSPAGSVTGLSSNEHNGTLHRNTAVSAGAMADANALAAALDARSATPTPTPTLTGTASPGVHTSSTGTLTVSGHLVLDARGDASAQFIFHARAITFAHGAVVTLTGAARAANVYWRATETITLSRGNVTTRGTHLAQGRIAGNVGAAGSLGERHTVEGRLISLDGAIDVAYTTTSLPA